MGLELSTTSSSESDFHLVDHRQRTMTPTRVVVRDMIHLVRFPLIRYFSM